RSHFSGVCYVFPRSFPISLPGNRASTLYPASVGGGRVMATGTHHLPRPKSYDDAAREFANAVAQPQVARNYFAAGMLATSLLSFGLLVLNFLPQALQRQRFVFRIDGVGRAQALGYSSLQYKPQAPEIKYFLTQFVHDYYGRKRATVREDFERSMAFLNSS